MPESVLRRVLAVTVLCACAALGSFIAGRAACIDPFDSYRVVRGRIVAYQRQQVAPETLWLLGSSTFERLNTGRLGTAVTNLAVGGDTIADVAQRLPSTEQLARSSGVLIHVGFNDLKQGLSAEEALRLYDDLLAAVYPAPSTICVTLQPLAPGTAQASRQLAGHLRAFNDGIRQRCNGSGRRHVVDLEQLLASADEGHGARLYADDVHLSEAGYDVLAAALRDAVASRPEPTT